MNKRNTHTQRHHRMSDPFPHDCEHIDLILTKPLMKEDYNLSFYEMKRPLPTGFPNETRLFAFGQPRGQRLWVVAADDNGGLRTFRDDVDMHGVIYLGDARICLYKLRDVVLRARNETRQQDDDDDDDEPGIVYAARALANNDEFHKRLRQAFCSLTGRPDIALTASLSATPLSSSSLTSTFCHHF